MHGWRSPIFLRGGNTYPKKSSIINFIKCVKLLMGAANPFVSGHSSPKKPLLRDRERASRGPGRVDSSGGPLGPVWQDRGWTTGGSGFTIRNFMSALFFKRFLQKPFQIASIIPSSKALVERVASKMD